MTNSNMQMVESLAEWADFHHKNGYGETRKAHERRKAEGWFEKYAPTDRPGLDIGSQFDSLNFIYRRWDYIFGDGDGEFLYGVPDESFWTVYNSHILEHARNPENALKHWWRVLHPGGHLIIVVPHRDLYEKKTTIPSRWNPDHKWFWLPDRDEAPNTLSLQHLIERALPEGELVSLQVLDSGYDYTLPPHVHAVGEYSIEAIVRKRD